MTATGAAGARASYSDTAMFEILLILAKDASKKRATATARGWKQHTCVHCGGRYRYRMERKETGKADSVEAARQAAEGIAHSALKTEFEQRPCPTCGVYQPDMVAFRRLRPHTLVFLGLSLALLGAVPALVVSLLSTWAYFLAPVTPWVVAAVAGVGLLAHLRINANDPNRDRSANLQATQAHLKSGVVLLVEAGDEARAREASAGAGGQFANLFDSGALMLAVLLLIPTGEVLRLSNGWPLNRDCEPILVGPGDRVRVRFPDTIRCVNGYWRGEGRAEILNADEVGVSRELTLTTSGNHWGESITVEEGGGNRVEHLWGRVEVPDDPKVTGRTLQIKMDLTAVYPQPRPRGFENTQVTATHTAALSVAADRAVGRTYMTYYLVGALAGIALVWVTSAAFVLRTKSARRRALPTEIISSETAW